MAKISNALVKTSSGAYKRLFNNERLGILTSKIQSTVISNGTELEKLILSRTNKINDLNLFIDDVTAGNKDNGTYVCKKTVLKKSNYYLAGHQPDLLIFIVAQRRICKIVELKDGDMFDTKKASGEFRSLTDFCAHLGMRIPFVTDFFICSFNNNDKDAIREGFKNVFPLNNIMTGRELCQILNINYDEIIWIRNQDSEDNLDYFINELLEIPEVKNKIIAKLDRNN